MTVRLATLDGAPVNFPVPTNRADIIKQMADHILAGITVGLDVTSDYDVIRYLKNTPEAYPAKVITAHMDEAIYQARQTLVAAMIARP
ncbi:MULTISPECIES: hypothetical protein [unclassified Bradyrhizobium]